MHIFLSTQALQYDFVAGCLGSACATSQCALPMCGTNPIGSRVIEEIPHVHQVTWKLAMLMKKLKQNMGSLNLNLLIQNISPVCGSLQMCESIVRCQIKFESLQLVHLYVEL